jgi:hypothetical protein
MPRENFFMSASQLQLTKSETRQLAENELNTIAGRVFQPTEWHMSNATFFTAFVAIAAVLAVLALVLR